MSFSAQLGDRARRATPDVAKLATALADSLGSVERELYQVKNQSPKDKIAFPIRLNDRLTGLRSNLERGDGPPPESYERVFRELSAALDVQLAKLRRLLENNLAALNRRLADARLPAARARE